MTKKDRCYFSMKNRSSTEKILEFTPDYQPAIAYLIRKLQGHAIKYVLSNTGVYIMDQDVPLAFFSWEKVEDVVVCHGPCEPNRYYKEPLLVSMFYHGPYGVYITMRTKTSSGNHIEKKEVFNLGFPDSLNAPTDYPVIYLCTKIRWKKGLQLRKQILEMRKNGIKEITHKFFVITKTRLQWGRVKLISIFHHNDRSHAE